MEEIDFKKFPLQDVGISSELVGAVWHREAEDYIVYFPGTLPGRQLSVFPDHAEWERLIRQSDIVETEVLARAKDGKLYKAIMRKSARQISTQTSWNVFRRDGYACRYCGNDKVPLTVDHLVLWEDGGPSTEANLVAACKRCNKQRGNTPYADWLQSSFYLRVSRGLSAETREANQILVPALDRVERRVHKGSRR